MDKIEEVSFYNKKMQEEKKLGKYNIMFNICTNTQLQFIDSILEEINERNINFSCYLSCDYDVSEYIKDTIWSDIPFTTSDVARELQYTDAFLETEIYGRGPKNAEKIFIGHGQPNKINNWSEENLKSFEHYFLYGELERSMFDIVIQKNPKVAEHIKYYNVGYPKLDKQIRGIYNRNEILISMGLNPDFKTVIYAPAWDPGCSLRKYGMQIVSLLLSMEKVNVIVKLHPASIVGRNSPYWDFYTGGVMWEEKFRIFCENNRFKYVGDVPVNPFLVAADVLITDFSGVALEFMILDRPVVYIDCPEFYERTLKEWGCDANIAKYDDRFNAGRNVGYLIEDIDLLQTAVIHAFNNPMELSPKRKALINQFLYNPGNGASATVDAILKILNK